LLDAGGGLWVDGAKNIGVAWQAGLQPEGMALYFDPATSFGTIDCYNQQYFAQAAHKHIEILCEDLFIWGRTNGTVFSDFDNQPFRTNPEGTATRVYINGNTTVTTNLSVGKAVILPTNSTFAVPTLTLGGVSLVCSNGSLW